MKTYKITVTAEANTSIVKELTEEQYEFLNNLFEELNDTAGRYDPYISIYDENSVDDEDEDDFDEDVDW